jgi:hypothetical protein
MEEESVANQLVGLRRRLVVAAAIAALTVLGGFAGTARAALLPNLLPGVLGPADTASACDASKQAFARWGDSAYYMLMPGGSFESGTPAWSLAGAARVVDGNEPFHLNQAGDTRSLALLAGASATTPSMCYRGDMGKLRFVARGKGTLRVQVIVRSATGSLLSTLDSVLLDGGAITGTGDWTPSREIYLALSQLGGLLVTDSISFRFVAESGWWQIDDASLDPNYNW